MRVSRTAPALQEPAPAKVNLFLHVGGKRAGGYHDLTSLVVFPQVGDVVTVAPAKSLSFAMKGPFADKLRAEEQRLAPLPSFGRLSPQEGGGRLTDGKSSPARAGEVSERSEGEGGRRTVCARGFPPSSLRDTPPAFGEGRFEDRKSSPAQAGEVPERSEGEGGRWSARGFPPSSRSATLPPADAGGRSDNLVLRAAEELARGRSVPGAEIVLTKNLPIASGIGGGSADAAATLRVLNELWGLRLPKDELRALGLKIGSDVPVCIDPKPQWMEGRGERLERGPRLPEFFMALVNPGMAVPTGPVFKALTKKSGAKRPAAPKSFSSARSLSAWLAAETRNDLQAPAIGIAPPVADVLAQLETQTGCLLARMSGSGATCFGLFESLREAKRAAAAMPGAWWAKAARCG